MDYKDRGAAKEQNLLNWVGMVKTVHRMNEQLSEMMMYTGIADTRSFDASVIHFL